MTAHDPIQRSTAAFYAPSSNGPGGSLCTASLISRNTAVTAAHCLGGSSYSPVMIFAPNVRSPDSVQRPVTGSVVNPVWGQRSARALDQGDIAVVKFGGGLPKGYRPATLDGVDETRKGDAAILAGYGVANARTHEGAGVLRKTTVKVANARHGKSEMIFDQSHGRGACHGDSGGPAYFQRGRKMVLGGITNRSYPNSASDDCAHKVVYTKVAAYRPWIEKSETELNRNSPRITAVAQPHTPEIRTLAHRYVKHAAHASVKKVKRPVAKHITKPIMKSVARHGRRHSTRVARR